MNYISNSLTDIAARFKIEDEAVKTSLKNSLPHAIAAGKLLIEAKAQLKHGEWEKWLIDNCSVSLKTGRNYMRVAKIEYNHRLVNKEGDADLSIRAALRLLAPPSSKKPEPSRSRPKLEAAKEWTQAYKAETGKFPTELMIKQGAGVSDKIARNALYILQDRTDSDRGEVKFTKAQDRHVEARLRILTKANNAEFNERVRVAMLENNKTYLESLERLEKQAREKFELYEELINKHQPIFTSEEYKTLLRVAHPDRSASKEMHETAFKALKAKEVQLIGKKS